MLNVNEIWSTKVKERIWTKDGNPNTLYGEITEMGAVDIIDLFKPTKDDVIIDIGSGTGRLCAHLAVETDATVIGVEMKDSRHREAVRMFGQYGLDNLKYKFGSYPMKLDKEPTIVIIHGCGFDAKNIHKIWDALPHGVRVLHNTVKSRIFDDLTEKKNIKINVGYMKQTGANFTYGVKK
jgi:precorrin-6B methylase 2